MTAAGTTDGQPIEGPGQSGAGPASPPARGRIFSLEGRPGPGLYLVAWLFSVGGSALVLIGVQATPAARGLLVLIGLMSVGLGLASGCGYQVLARASLPAVRYRGPSPILAFGLAAALGSAGGLVFGLLGLFDPDTPVGFLLGLLIVGAGYLVTVVFLVVRTGALAWSEMGWPVGPGRLARAAREAAFGLAVTVPAVIPVLLLAALLASLIGVEPAGRIPSVATDPDALLVVVAAAFVAPLGEELFFRGFALAAWQREIGPRRALVRGAIFFALVHVLNEGGTTFGEAAGQALLQFSVILPVGLVLGWVYQRRGIAAAIAGHAGYNGALLLLALAVSRAVPGA